MDKTTGTRTATAKAAAAPSETRTQELLRSRERRHRVFLLAVGAIVVAWVVGQWAFNAHQNHERKAAAARKHVHGERVRDTDTLPYNHVEGDIGYPMTKSRTRRPLHGRPHRSMTNAVTGLAGMVPCPWFLLR